ncbi:MAG: hypothetical protein C4291_10535 [Candidatus Dadabacteria bacterium]
MSGRPPCGYGLFKNRLSVLWYPYKMIFKVLYHMRDSLWAHTRILYSFMPKGQSVFIPVVELSGYSTGSLIKKPNVFILALDKIRAYSLLEVISKPS